jgi:CDP-glucose 4,6-dehydratase
MTFWNGKRVLVTGHTGFKGSWLSLWLQQRGAALTGFAKAPPTQPSMFVEAGVAEGMDSQIGDVTSFEQVREVFQRSSPEIVFHMAAQPLVRYSFEHPVETYATNVMGTVHVLEAARQTPSVRSVVVVTSDKCYENREWVWGYRENEPMGGYDPYSNSKGCAELVTAAYRSSFFGGSQASVGSGRAGNVIGGGDWATDRLLPDIIRSWMAGKAVPIRRPQSIRPWQHVLEPLSGYLLLAEQLYKRGHDVAEGWNFGPNDEDARPVGWIVERMGELWGEGARWQLDEGPHPHEAHYLKLDCSKARMQLGWAPRLSLHEALEWTVEWFRGYQQGASMRALTQTQINRYEALSERGR